MLLCLLYRYDLCLFGIFDRFFFLFFFIVWFSSFFFFFFSSRRRHTRCLSDWSSDVCSSDLALLLVPLQVLHPDRRRRGHACPPSRPARPAARAPRQGGLPDGSVLLLRARRADRVGARDAPPRHVALRPFPALDP